MSSLTMVLHNSRKCMDPYIGIIHLFMHFHVETNPSVPDSNIGSCRIISSSTICTGVPDRYRFMTSNRILTTFPGVG